MPLIQPSKLREKLLVIGGGGAGKTYAHLLIAWYAFQSDDPRKFFILDTDDEAVQHVLFEPKFAELLHSIDGEVVNPSGNIHLFSARTWQDYLDFRDYVLKNHNEYDWVVIDFITTAWKAVRDAWLEDHVGKTHGQALQDASKQGLTGWDMFKVDYNYTVINAMYFDWLEPISLRTRTHLFWTAEMDEINESARNMPQDQKDHLRQFGKWKAAGQKKLSHQCRSYLRLQQLARGRVIFTNGKDRARKVLDGDDCNDFVKDYLVSVAGWRIE